MDSPFLPIPTKTPLGVDEQRRRSAGLGQRHRTILFLVDGRRPLGEVLRLAQQAGATVQHFEDLVRLGHVDVPRPPEPPPEPADVDGAPPEAADSAVGELAEIPLPLPEVDTPEPADPAPLPAVVDTAEPEAAPAPVAEGDAAADAVAADPAAAPLPPTPAAADSPFARAPVLPSLSLDLPPGVRGGPV